MRLPAAVLALACAASTAAQEPDGASLFARPDKGHCAACHQVPGAARRADLGPVLTGERMRSLGKPDLREVIADPTRANPGTVMPPFGRHRILESREIDRLVEYLHALPPDPASGVAVDSAPRARATDDAVAAAPVVAAGKALFNRKFKNGRSLAGCFPNGGKRIAGAYPLYDAKQKRVVTLETAINQCLRTHSETAYDPTDPETMGAVVAYVRSLSDRQKIAVRVPAAAEERVEAGRRLYASRIGQRNYACASCHVQGAGKRYDGEVLSAAAGQAAHAPVIRDGKAVTLQARMRECLERMGAAPFPAGSEELNHLEYYLTVRANGLTLQPNAWRER